MPNETAPPDRPPLLREQHCCLPLERHADIGELARHRRPGGSFVPVNAVGIFHGPADACVDALVRHIDHAVDLVGPEHVEGAPRVRGCPEDAVAATSGGNFRRVAEQVRC